MKNYFYSFFALAALLASCSSDREDIQVDDKSASDVKYLLSSKPFEFEDDTRVTFTLDNQKNQLTFGWSYNEVFGVFPMNPSNSQASWKLDYQCDVDEAGHSGKDTHYALFDGEGWALSNGVEYAAYQPCQDVLSSVRYTAVPVTLTNYQGGTLEAIGSGYDYLYATGTYEEPTEAGHYSHVIFDFNHAISIIQVSIANAPQDFEFNNAVITSAGDKFVTSGTLNVGTGDVTGTASASSVSVNGCESDGKTFYVALFPTVTGECTVRVNGIYEFTVPSKNLVKGKAYRWTLDFNNATEMVTTYTAPTIRTGSSTYNTNAQNLLATTGSAENGTLSYSYRYKTIGGSYGSWSSWSTTAPTGTNAGVYEVKYKVEPASGYTGGAGETSLGEFTINKANGYVTLSPNSSSGWGGVTNKSASASISHHGGTLSLSKSGTYAPMVNASINGQTLSLSKTMAYGRGDGVTVTVTSAATTNYNAASATYYCNN
ncbi:MAG: hypothetical protein J5663_09990 [Bacteroidaceae bacterium]|nr:hypothetical protein [Bacteroidaceae bacterium]